MKNKCEFCSSEITQREITVQTENVKFGTNEKISVQAKQIECTNPNCDFAYISREEDERIANVIARESRYVTQPEDIADLRRALGFNTKSEASEFLCLNSKAFSKWENGKSEANWSTELLLRLAAFSRRNFEFIKHLHESNFKYDPADYESISETKGLHWTFSETVLMELPNIWSNLGNLVQDNVLNEASQPIEPKEKASYLYLLDEREAKLA